MAPLLAPRHVIRFGQRLALLDLIVSGNVLRSGRPGRGSTIRSCGFAFPAGCCVRAAPTMVGPPCTWATRVPEPGVPTSHPSAMSWVEACTTVPRDKRRSAARLRLPGIRDPAASRSDRTASRRAASRDRPTPTAPGTTSRCRSRPAAGPCGSGVPRMFHGLPCCFRQGSSGETGPGGRHTPPARNHQGLTRCVLGRPSLPLISE